MPRYRLTIEYDGGAFKGFQAQAEGVPSVQASIERAIQGFSGQFARVHVAGRTDTGVHALGQVIHFDLDKDWPADVGAPLLIQALGLIERGDAVETPQSAEGVTYARKITPAEAHIDWSRPAAEVDRQIRGLSPFPGAWFTVEGPRGPVRVKALLSEAGLGSGPVATVLGDHLVVGCGQGAVRLLRLQREGQKPQDAADFLRGFPVPAGTVLG